MVWLCRDPLWELDHGYSPRGRPKKNGTLRGTGTGTGEGVEEKEAEGGVGRCRDEIPSIAKFSVRYGV